MIIADLERAHANERGSGKIFLEVDEVMRVMRIESVVLISGFMIFSPSQAHDGVHAHSVVAQLLCNCALGLTIPNIPAE